MYEYIKKLKPYFFSIREIDTNVSFDIKIPTTWKYDDITTSYKHIKIKVQDKNDNTTLISFITNSSMDGYNMLISCVNEVIKKNQEDEEKSKLFEKKVSELKDLFRRENLDKLKDITFIESYEHTTDEVVGERTREGQDGSDRNEDEVDQGPQDVE
jgi:hypothetical protein